MPSAQGTLTIASRARTEQEANSSRSPCHDSGQLPLLLAAKHAMHSRLLVPSLVFVPRHAGQDRLAGQPRKDMLAA